MSSVHMDRRAFVKTAAMGALASSPLWLSVQPGAAQGLTRLRLQLGWIVSNGILGEVVAMKKGFYAEQSLALEIVPGGPNVDGIAGVASRRSALGHIVSSPSVMMARGAGMPVKAIAAGYQKHPYTFFSRAEKPIRTPQDMIGKTIAVQPTGAILLRALLAKNGIAEHQVKVLHVGADLNALMTGQADAVSAWKTNTAALKVLGDKRVELMLWDTGIQLYANVYLTTDGELAERPQDIAKFMAATAKGWGYARANPEEAVSLLVQTYPNLDRQSELETVAPLMQFAFNDVTQAQGWGAMTRENWAAQISVYESLGQFKEGVPTVDDIMTLSILDATADVRKAIG